MTLLSLRKPFSLSAEVNIGNLSAFVTECYNIQPNITENAETEQTLPY